MSRFFKNEGESIEQFHNRLMANYGCNDCSELGNNGCGDWQIDGYQFEPDDTAYYSEPDGCSCLKLSKRRLDAMELSAFAHLTNNERRIEGAAAEFKRYIQAAMEVAPDGMPPDIYGEIVRSAAAVYCHQGKDTHREAEA